MKVRTWFLVFFLVITLGVFFLPGVNSAQAGPIELRFANLFGPVHLHSKTFEAWGKEIEKRTGGKVKFTYYHGGTLLKGAKIYDGVLTGIADVGMSVFGYSRGVFPSIQAIDLPHAYPSGKVATRVINDFAKRFKPDELTNAKFLYLHAHGPGLLQSKKVVRKLEDLKGLKIRSYGFNAKVAELLGGVPVAMPQPGVYEALQKGVVDASLSPYEVLDGWKQAEVIKCTVECYSVGYTAGFFLVMNMKKWKSLPYDVQAVMEQVSEEWIPKTGEVWDEMDRRGKKATLKKGNQIVTLSSSEAARWAKAVEPVFESYIKSASKKGLPARDYVNFLRKAVKQ
ncbi:MAG: TRAP transporter substrate-binding protein [Desulfobacteraceae bacterium]|jgi:TRAP-type C4-dicarboxylate transport system substrate-binding protein